MNVGLYVTLRGKSSPEVPTELRGADQEHPEHPPICACACVCVSRSVVFYAGFGMSPWRYPVFYDEVELFDHKHLTTTMTKSRFLR